MGAAERRDESGSMSILTLGLVLIAVILIVGGVSVTSAIVARMRLIDLADGAALTAANSLAGGYTGGLGTSIPLSDESVRAAVEEYAASRPVPQDLTALAIADPTGSPDGQTAVVTLAATVEIPLVGGLLDAVGGEVSVAVTSRARATLEP